MLLLLVRLDEQAFRKKLPENSLDPLTTIMRMQYYLKNKVLKSLLEFLLGKLLE